LIRILPAEFKMISENHRFDRRILWLLIAFEALLFYSFYSREISWYPAQYFDQNVYLTEAYRLQERILGHGLSEFWRALWDNQHFSGLALPIEGALSGLLLGGTRFPQLCVLFIAFCALQAVAFATAQTVWERRAFGYMVLGLLLSQSTLWFYAGGLFDFRIDFLAYCLYGIWTCTVIKSKLFLDRRLSIASGLIGAFLVLNRFLTVIYLVGVSVGFAGFCIIIWFLRRGDPDLARRMRQRLFNLSLSLGILVVIVGPILLINRKAIFYKYVFAQFFYEKDIRAREFGIVGLSGHLLYYPASILRDHWGPIFLWASAIGIAGALGARLLGKAKSLPAALAIRPDEAFLLQFIFLVGAILGPIVVLTVDVSKSPVIGGIVGVPATLLVLTVIARLEPDSRESEPLPVNLIVVTSLIVFALGLFNQFSHASRHVPEYAQRRDLERLSELNKWLVKYADENGWNKPSISFDVISGWLEAGAITTSGFEQSHHLVEFQTMLGSGIMGADRAEAFSLLENSNFLILTDIPKTGVYPFYERIARYWSDLKAWAEDHMIVARTVRFDSFTATVYVRPTATVSVTPGGWVTSGGLSIETMRASLQRLPKIRLFGWANYSWLPKIPVVSATIETEGDSQTVLASFRRVDDNYEILIDTASIKLPSSERIRLHIAFDTFFVPKKLGINDDTRELVVPAPSLVQFVRAVP
jgi:hypothetical protein